MIAPDGVHGHAGGHVDVHVAVGVLDGHALALLEDDGESPATTREGLVLGRLLHERQDLGTRRLGHHAGRVRPGQLHQSCFECFCIDHGVPSITFESVTDASSQRRRFMILKYHMLTRTLRDKQAALSAVTAASERPWRAPRPACRQVPRSSLVRARVAAVLGERHGGLPHRVGAGDARLRAEAAGRDDHTYRGDEVARLVAHRRDDGAGAEVVLFEVEGEALRADLLELGREVDRIGDRGRGQLPVRPLDDLRALGEPASSPRTSCRARSPCRR